MRGISLRSVCILALVMVGAAVAVPVYSQTASPPGASAPGQTVDLRAAAIISPPFVMEQDGSLTGFNIELWNAIAAQLKLKTSYQVLPDIASVEAALRSNSVDLVVAPLFITSARAEAFDFSVPMVESGLQIMVRDTGQTAGTVNPLWTVHRLLFSWTTVLWLGTALVLILIPGHLIWLFERRHEGGVIKSRNYFPGIFEALYWAVSFLMGRQEALPHQWVARVFSVFWMFAGVVFVAFYTAQLTTTLTVERIRSGIEGPADLPGKQIATAAGSTAVEYLREHKALVREFPPDGVIKALLDQQVDGVVTAAPALQYYAAHDGKGRVKMVGPEFDIAPIAIMVPLDSPLRRRIDRALLALRENGTYQQLYDKWFGSP